MSLLLLKLLLTPLLVGAATIAARRWGQVIGGWVTGLPLTSGPVSVFLAIERGPEFAGRAAEATVLGLAGVAAFCLTYHRAMSFLSPLSALAVSIGAFMLITLGASVVPSGLAAAAIVSVGVLGVALAAVGAPPPQVPAIPSSRWDLPLRMVVATTMVLAITGGAAVLGPRWSGLLSPFPVFASVMTVFAHHASGRSSAHGVLRGIIVGSFAFAAFFVVLALALGTTSLVLAYGLAVIAALVVNGASLFVLRGDARYGGHQPPREGELR
ncbi:MAG TPA: hypothetical protein VKE51_19220 [Vicinamibacterales bacterium]|nr:hypothetical protein [Vicinamibacterales bacterium]